MAGQAISTGLDRLTPNLLLWKHMKFGFHVSIQGGLSRAVARAKALECECLQIFSRSPRSWNIKQLAAEEVISFKQELSQAAIAPCVIHTPYLLNLCAEEKEILHKSRRALVQDLKRAELIGADYVVVHMGTRKTNSEAQALDLMTQSINYVWESAGPSGIKLLLENTSGGGGKLGYSFKHFRRILELAGEKNKLGFCLDTAHLFQAGYDIKTRQGLKKTLKEFEEEVGLERLFLLHLNDSLTPLGSGYDRHWHIGRGFIGKRGFKHILHHPLLKNLPVIMETPKKSDDDDLMNMRVVRRLQRKNIFSRFLGLD
jgi:deoxyribonuclease-4